MRQRDHETQRVNLEFRNSAPLVKPRQCLSLIANMIEVSYVFFINQIKRDCEREGERERSTQRELAKKRKTNRQQITENHTSRQFKKK